MGEELYIPKISIITPVYNNPTIIHCIRSVQSQVGVKVEHIVVDGKSTDSTAAILAQERQGVSRIISESDQGLYDAINKGIRESGYDIVGILNSDDSYNDCNVLFDVAGKFSEGADLVYGDLQYIAGSESHRILRHWRGGPFQRRSLVFGWMPPHPTVFVRRWVYDRFGLFDLSFRISADYDFLTRVLSSPTVRVGYVRRVLVKMTRGGISNGSVRNILRKTKEDLRVAAKNGYPAVVTVGLKNLRKVSQFFSR